MTASAAAAAVAAVGDAFARSARLLLLLTVHPLVSPFGT
jgi:hypothetical protein